MAGCGLVILVGGVAGLPLLPYLSIRIRVEDGGLRVTQRGRKRLIAWREIGSVKRSDALQIMRVRSGSGAVLFNIDYWIRGQAGLDAAIRKHAGK